MDMANIPEREVLDLLHRRRGFLDGLCVGGGEPTLHRELPGFLYRVKSLGYGVKLDTNGSRPKMLRKLMDEALVDYVAMDIKAPFSRYAEVVRFKVDVEAVRQSIKMLRRGGIDYEFRTTVVPGVLSGEDIEEIAKAIVGSKRYVIQQFRPGSTLCPEFSRTAPYGVDVLEQFRSRVAHYFGECRLRA